MVPVPEVSPSIFVHLSKSTIKAWATGRTNDDVLKSRSLGETEVGFQRLWGIGLISAAMQYCCCWLNLISSFMREIWLDKCVMCIRHLKRH